MHTNKILLGCDAYLYILGLIRPTAFLPEPVDAVRTGVSMTDVEKFTKAPEKAVTPICFHRIVNGLMVLAWWSASSSLLHHKNTITKPRRTYLLYVTVSITMITKVN
jgi:hypothetical protein